MDGVSFSRVQCSRTVVMFLLAVLACSVLPRVAAAKEIQVPAQYRTIQAAIDAAASGDVVVVADGVYTGAGNRNLTWTWKEKHLTVKSLNGPARCIIDCASAGRGFIFSDSGQNNSDIVQGFTIRNGSADYGGAIYCKNVSPTITGNVLTKNTASKSGGAIAVCGGSPLIRGNVISWNTAQSQEGSFGGGIWALEGTGPLIITENRIAANGASAGGGGICLDPRCSLVVTYNTIVFNGSSRGNGGGISLGSGCSGVISGNSISANAADSGGGVLADTDGSLLMSNNVIAGNVGNNQGGGISEAGGASVVDVVNNLVAGNRSYGWGGGIFGNFRLFANNTVALNQGGGAGGLFSGNNFTTENCIFWGNGDSNGPNQISVNWTSWMGVDHSDVQGGYDGIGSTQVSWGAGNIDKDPRFAGGPSGTWTRDATYDETRVRSTLTDTQVVFAPNALVGKLLQPDTSVVRQYPIVANTATTITIDGGFSSITAGASYQIYDYHLAPNSPCIDAGIGDDGVSVPLLDMQGNPRWDDPAVDNTGTGTPDFTDMGAFERGLPGDVNDDHAVDIADAVGALRMVTGLDVVDIYRADVDGDGDVTINDVVLILRKAVLLA